MACASKKEGEDNRLNLPMVIIKQSACPQPIKVGVSAMHDDAMVRAERCSIAGNENTGVIEFEVI